MNDKLKNIEIPEGWEEVELGNNLYFKILGSGIKYFDGVKEYLSTSSIEGSKVVDIEQEITYKNRPSRANMQPIQNSVWFAKMKNTLKIFNPTDKQINQTILSTGFCGVLLNNVSSDFLFQIFLSNEFNNQKDLLAIGSTQEAINNEKAKQIHFLLPTSLTEQKKIAQILSTVDKAIEQTEQLIAKYERIKTGLMQDLLTKGIDENGNIRSEETHEFKDSELGRIPVEWECGSILNYCTREDNVKPGPFGSSVKKEFYSDNGFKIYGQEQVISGDIHYGNYFIDKKRYKALRNFAVKEGDILLSCVGTIGNVLIIPKDFKKGIINPRLMKITLDIAKSDKLFFSYLLKSDFINRQLLSQATGGTMPVLNKSIILNLFFVYPIKMEQKRISKRIQSAEKNINKTISQLQKLQRIKTALMQDLLSGKKRVSNLIMNGE